MSVNLIVFATKTYVTGVGHGSVLEAAISAELFYLVPGYERDDRFKFGLWDGKESLFVRDESGQGHIVATGLVPRLCRMFAAHNTVYEVTSCVNDWKREPSMAYLNKETLSTREYQTSAAMSVFRKQELATKFIGQPGPLFPRRGGVIQAATGGGKTRIATKLIQLVQMFTVFIVNQKDLQAQTIDEFERMLGCKVGIVGDGKCDIRDITVATVQTIALAAADNAETPEAAERNARVREMMCRAGLVIADECHGTPAQTAQAAISLAENAAFVVGLSASPWRDDGLGLLIEAACGPTTYKISATDLIKMGFLVQPHIFVHRLPKPQDAAPDRLDTEQYTKFYDAWVTNDDTRNRYIANKVIADIVDGHIAIVLVKRVPHGEALQKLIPHSTFLEGKISAKKRKKILEDVKSGETLCLIATSLADQGLDIPIASSLHLAGGGKSSTKALQRVGRVLRIAPGKTTALVHDYVDAHDTLRNQYYHRLSIYRSEPAFEQSMTQINVDYPTLVG